MIEESNEVLVVWCEDTDEWGITNGRNNTTWTRFPNNYSDIMKAVSSVHETGKKATFLMGRGASTTFHLDGHRTEVEGW